ncbi:hypothetical protein LJC20_05995 [Eubacteriales bacterium OttesenSCG-928-M02]|nr:hypothetical protein [Eubacteriales bacterium OttesenSCG-928-M02]
MSAQTWMIIGIAGFFVAALLLFVAVMLFIRWRIPSVVGDLTGLTEKRQIAKMKKDQEAAASRVNIRPQAFLFENAPAQGAVDAPLGTEITDVLGQQPELEERLSASVGTEVLTELLDMPEMVDANATTILEEMVLEVAEEVPGEKVAFAIKKRVKVVHTQEVIE